MARSVCENSLSPSARLSACPAIVEFIQDSTEAIETRSSNSTRRTYYVIYSKTRRSSTVNGSEIHSSSTSQACQLYCTMNNQRNSERWLVVRACEALLGRRRDVGNQMKTIEASQNLLAHCPIYSPASHFSLRSQSLDAHSLQVARLSLLSTPHYA